VLFTIRIISYNSQNYNWCWWKRYKSRSRYCSWDARLDYWGKTEGSRFKPAIFLYDDWCRI